jgi:SPOR domain
MKQLVMALVVLFVAIAVYVFTLPPRKITIKDIHPAVPVHAGSTGPAVPGPARAESPVKDVIDKPAVEYYIIIESFKSKPIAEQKAEQLRRKLNKDIIVLPVTKEGFYRISSGKYPTPEDAETAVKEAREGIRADAWIFSVRK